MLSWPLQHSWIIEFGGCLIGHIRLDRADLRDRRTSLAVGIEDKTLLGLGLGPEAIKLVLEYAFDVLKLHRVSVRVLAYNTPAIRAYEKCGFVIEGREREAAFVDGAWYDDVIMGIIENEFRGGRGLWKRPLRVVCHERATRRVEGPADSDHLAAQASALFAMLKFPSPHVAYLASAVFGFAVGVMITLPALIIQRECPPAAFGMLSGLTLAIIQTGNAFGPSLLGWLRDATGSYAVPIIACMALEISALAIIVLRIGPAKDVAPNGNGRLP